MRNNNIIYKAISNLDNQHKKIEIELKDTKTTAGTYRYNYTVWNEKGLVSCQGMRKTSDEIKEVIEKYKSDYSMVLIENKPKLKMYPMQFKEWQVKILNYVNNNLQTIKV